MLGNVVIGLIALVFVYKSMWALRTGETQAKRSVIRRSETPFAFYLLIGMYLLLAAVGLDIAFEAKLLMVLINLRL